MRILQIISLIGSVFFLGMGFHKMFAYKNFEDSFLEDQNVNSYVGGDAYNYIINGTYSTAFFVLGGALFLGAIGLEIVTLLNSYINQKNSSAVESKVSDNQDNEIVEGTV